MAASREKENNHQKIASVLFVEECSDPGIGGWLQESRNILSDNTMLLTSMACAEHRDPGAHVDGYVDIVVPRYTDRQFRDHFRMSKSTFEELCQWVAPHLAKERTVTVETKMLASVWLLSNQESYRGVADRFGTNKGSLHRMVLDVCKALTSLRGEIICWPTNQCTLQSLAEEFKKVAGMPGVIGCIDGTHIQIPGPSEHRDAYINRKGYPSMQLQVVCDHKLSFLDVYTGWPGSVHDSRVFNNSPLKTELDTLPPQYHLLGDSAYALSQHMLVPFRDNGHLSPVEKGFNKAHSSTRVQVEMSIGLLKGKFRRLKMLEVHNVSDAPFFIFSACVLHCFILKHSDTMDLDYIAHDEVEPEADQADFEQVAPGATSKRLDIAQLL